MFTSNQNGVADKVASVHVFDTVAVILVQLDVILNPCPHPPRVVTHLAVVVLDGPGEDAECQDQERCHGGEDRDGEAEILRGRGRQGGLGGWLCSLVTITGRGRDLREVK